jgi:hypothetical protein
MNASRPPRYSPFLGRHRVSSTFVRNGRLGQPNQTAVAPASSSAPAVERTKVCPSNCRMILVPADPAAVSILSVAQALLIPMGELAESAATKGAESDSRKRERSEAPVSGTADVVPLPEKEATPTIESSSKVDDAFVLRNVVRSSVVLWPDSTVGAVAHAAAIIEWRRPLDDGTSPNDSKPVTAANGRYSLVLSCASINFDGSTKVVPLGVVRFVEVSGAKTEDQGYTRRVVPVRDKAFHQSMAEAGFSAGGVILVQRVADVVTAQRDFGSSKIISEAKE